MSSRYDAVIIGGGVIGCFLAYQLTKRGKKVALVEQGELASGASGAAAGMLAADCEHFEHPELKSMARLSRDAFPSVIRELRQLSGIDAGLNERGFLVPARDAQEAEELHAGMLADCSGEWWRPEKLQTAEPALCKALHGAVYRAEETQLLPARLTEALAYSAQSKGAELLLQTKAAEIREINGSVQGVMTSRGLLECEQAVLAGGWQMDQLLQPLGLTLPLEPVKGEIVEVHSESPLLTSTLYARNVYIVPKPGNKLWLGATSYSGDRSSGVRADSVYKLLSAGSEYIPEIRSSQFIRAWSGHRPKTPDGLPYLGGFSGIHGLYAAAGHYRNGVLMSAVSSSILANVMEGIATPGVNLEPFSPDRYQRQREGEMVL
ncbi:glycine oxidase ThiO [Paenibacillus tuaregi]|uniref:glycine oxidase ThiO n=1 Tax=Paenibacillus tuaregi TaxID=1816681 RepID=UPI000838760D|nr:glycine oxidase ThiO [Paenibacillus tuaregi]